MQQIIRYEGKCKNCGWVFAESKTPKIDNMPATCSKCGKDMSVVSVFQTDGMGRTYDLRIFCKENGVDMHDGVDLTEDEMLKLDKESLVKKLVEKLANAFANIVTDDKKVTMLLSNGGK